MGWMVGGGQQNAVVVQHTVQTDRQDQDPLSQSVSSLSLSTASCARAQ